MLFGLTMVFDIVADIRLLACCLSLVAGGCLVAAAVIYNLTHPRAAALEVILVEKSPQPTRNHSSPSPSPPIVAKSEKGWEEKNITPSQAYNMCI